MAQDYIPKHKLARAASLSVTGAKVGSNYLRYYGDKYFRGEDNRDRLYEDNARDTYESFSNLKGGPLKVAQMLSMDRNILPPAFQREFSQAQYSAPPLSYPLVVRTMKRDLGKGPNEIFDEFSQEAVAAASIGQVHRARRGDDEFAVKVQYPGVADSLQSDLRLVKPFAMRMFNMSARELDMYVQEVQERLLEETDYRLELERGIRLSEATAHLPHVHFPSYYPEYSGSRVITMQWLEGTHLDKYAQQNAPKEERDRIGQALWDFYHFQIHDLHEFHADPHPGNFKVKDGELWVLDFGCVKKLPEDYYQRYFRLLNLDLIDDDQRFLSLLGELDLLLPKDTPEERRLMISLFRESIHLLSRPYQQDTFDFGDPEFLKEIYEFGERTNRDPEIKRLNGARGSPHALYLNRAYFGLYNLLGEIGATIRAEIPSVAQGEAVAV